MISVIIPVLHEGEKINDFLKYLRRTSYNHSIEIIIVDSDEKRDTISCIKDSHVIKVSSSKGRGVQMNTGAVHAKGDIVLFLHSDTFLPNNAFEQIIDVMKSDKYVGGAFNLGFINRTWPYRLIAAVGSFRSRITRIPFGDQAIFLSRDYFIKIGRYNDLLLMEDVDLMKRIKKRGDKIDIIPLSVLTSSRRWEEQGIFYTTVKNWIILVLYFFGVHPNKLAQFYYRKK